MKRRYYSTILILAGVLLTGWLVSLKRDLFKGTPYSTVVTDRSGELLGARVAADGQWRFPPCDTVPERYARAVVQFEDRHFYLHPGVNPVSLARALVQNIRAGHVESGGSTLTMQVIRISRQRERNLWQKGIEAIQALRLEIRCSKKEILALYASHAPFGGNVVGLDAASWRYFGRPPSELSWAEAATLAVLPNAPSSMHPGKQRDALLEKRNRLLLRLLKHGDIDEAIYETAITEPLPDNPHPLPSLARHYVERQPRGKRTRTGIDIHLQRQVEVIADRWSDDLALYGIADLAALVIDLHSGETVAYVGNASPERKRSGMEVDIAAAPRSTGSILKPFLFCAALQDGLILPNTLIKDTPVNLGGFTPQNFDLQFHGAVHASEALARSLNVPAVHLLREYGVPRFHKLLRDAGLTTLTHDAAHYGLALILGGAEGRLDEITRAYAGLVLAPEGFPLTDPEAIWYTLDALKEVSRPDEIDPRLISSVRRVSWKTGTSYGFRDAWAVGVTPDYAVGVWCGNADGHGVPGLTGARAAGPVLFDLVNLLPEDSPWFEDPMEGVVADVCTASGYLAGPECPEKVTCVLPRKAQESGPCPYHKGGVFSLPPVMEWYYKAYHPEYEPPHKAGHDEAPLQFIYPEPGSILYLPRQMDGSPGAIAFQLAHRHPEKKVWWHLDGDYIGETQFIHEMMLSPAPGKHVLLTVDEEGQTASVAFSIAENTK